MKKLLTILLLAGIFCNAQRRDVLLTEGIIPAAERFELYLPMIEGRNVAIVANQTSLAGSAHLVDTLLGLGVQVNSVFAPEHGFRGEAGAGEKVEGGIDKRTGVRVISLYGKHLKPTQEDLKGIDAVIFDIQDVGVRFYTYISTLQYVMESCAEAGIPCIVLDRPNPLGHCIDGPVLNEKYRSFVGMQKIPVVHGMTVGEYACMLNEEGLLAGAKKCTLHVIPVKNYTHREKYVLPVRPSPNLPNMDAILLYPSLCFFEGTAVSLGRGTTLPFQLIGFPGFNGDTSFTPKSIPGVATNPPYRDTLCHGFVLTSDSLITKDGCISLKWLIRMYDAFPDKSKFFTPFFEKLAGTDELRKQIIAGKSEEEIRQTWEKGIAAFRKIRAKYLLYPD